MDPPPLHSSCECTCYVCPHVAYFTLLLRERHAMPWYAMTRHTTPCHTILHHAMPLCPHGCMPCHAHGVMPCPHGIMPCHAHAMSCPWYAMSRPWCHAMPPMVSCHVMPMVSCHVMPMPCHAHGVMPCPHGTILYHAIPRHAMMETKQTDR